MTSADETPEPLDGVVDLAPHGSVWAAALLAAAFADDPFMTWLVPRSASRQRRCARLFAAEIHRARADGRVLVADDGAGCAVWFAPRRWRPTGRAAAREALSAAGAVPIRGWRRGAMAFDRIARAHPKEPHWYLASVGTDPRRRGTGAGRKVIGAGLALADRHGVGAYLESSNVVNIPYYERFGFGVTEEIRLEGGPSLWGMWRDPVA